MRRCFFLNYFFLIKVAQISDFTGTIYLEWKPAYIHVCILTSAEVQQCQRVTFATITGNMNNETPSARGSTSFQRVTRRRHRFIKRNVSHGKQRGAWLAAASHVTSSQAEFPRQLEAERHGRIASPRKSSEIARPPLVSAPPDKPRSGMGDKRSPTR